MSVTISGSSILLLYLLKLYQFEAQVLPFYMVAFALVTLFDVIGIQFQFSINLSLKRGAIRIDI
jgi:hypothetical protein